MKRRFSVVILMFLVFAGIGNLYAGMALPHEGHGTEAANVMDNSSDHGAGDLGKRLPVWSVIPFVGILLSIALGPLVAPKFWHHHFGKISAFWALAFAIPFLIVEKGVAIHEILHIYFIDYIPFIILLWSLYTVSGGILLKGSIQGKPLTNTIMLLIGTMLSSWIGTTGSAMLLIRPLIRSNGHRKNKVHIIVFFIFLVANIGGSLTPLGDPPLFLGFLHGVSFTWTFALLPHMTFVSVIIMAVFFCLDTYHYKKEGVKEPEVEKEPLKLLGVLNIVFLLGVVGGVLFSGTVKLGHFNLFGIHMNWENVVRDVFLVLMGILSLRTTSKAIREGNNFNWFPIEEVAKIFAGIFMTIIPALVLLKAGTSGPLGFIVEAVKEPWHYFWITGGLSSFLDNAPTYLTFFNTAIGQFCPGMVEADAVKILMTGKKIFLEAISAGAVFLGAMTYIGNAPNFMVKSIAEENGISMPSFFGYMFKYSLIFLAPVFVVLTLVFF